MVGDKNILLARCIGYTKTVSNTTVLTLPWSCQTSLLAGPVTLLCLLLTLCTVSVPYRLMLASSIAFRYSGPAKSRSGKGRKAGERNHQWEPGVLGASSRDLL